MNGLAWRWADLPITDNDIKDVETALGVTIPPPLATLFRKGNGGSPSRTRYVLPDGDELVFNNLLNVKRDADDALVGVYAAVGSRLPTGLLPFGSDPFGNLFCLGSTGDGPVVFWRHELDATHDLLRLAPSLEGFLARLHA